MAIHVPCPPRSRKIVFAVTCTFALCALVVPAQGAADDAEDTTVRIVGATANTDFTTAFREFGDSGGGWADKGGWAASDGSYSVQLEDGSVAWLMNDTFMGPMVDGKIADDARFLHGTVLPADTNGYPVTTVTGGTQENPRSIADPPEAVDGNPWYWNEAGIVDGGALQVFQAKTALDPTVEPPFGFKWIGSDIVTYDAEYRIVDITATYGTEGGVHWGVGILTYDGHTYIYGQQNGEGFVARSPIGSLLNMESWEFFDGTGWNPSENSAAAIIDDVGATFSVSEVEGTFVLATTKTFAPFWEHQIDAAVSPSPAGPFLDRQTVFVAPEGGAGKLAPYNVSAHPWLSEPDTLLISYNVNAMDHADVLADPNNYRPRFVSIQLEPTDDGGGEIPEVVDPVAPDSSALTEETRTLDVPAQAIAGELLPIHSVGASDGDEVRFWLFSDPQYLGAQMVSGGGATVLIPSSTELKEHKIVATAADNSLISWGTTEVIAADEAGNPDPDPDPDPEESTDDVQSGGTSPASAKSPDALAKTGLDRAGLLTTVAAAAALLSVGAALMIQRSRRS